MSPNTSLGPGREFDVIRSLLRHWGDLARGIGDDAALLDAPRGQKLVISTDTSVENIHFRREWLSAREIGYRSTAAALSDLAAMAAKPVGVLLALAMPVHWVDDILKLADGIGEAVAQAQTHILGGDVSEAGELVVMVTVIGATTAPLGRAGACPGDTVYVTGTLGGPLASLRSWKAGQEPEDRARARFAHPVPRIQEARWLMDHGVRAGVDVSDGLAADLGHVAAASGVRITIDADSVPRISNSSALDAVKSGEEYELAVAGPAGIRAREFAQVFGIPLTAIGKVEAGAAGVEVTSGGKRVADVGGYSHF